MPDKKDIEAEDQKVRRLQRTVDLALFYIERGPVSRQEADMIVNDVRSKALDMFPGKEEAFDLIYHPRLVRAINSRFGLH